MNDEIFVLTGEDWEMYVADNDTPIPEEDFDEEF